MQFIQKPHLEWEPLFLRLVFEPDAAPESIVLQEQCVRRLQKRDAESPCACHLTFFHVRRADGECVELLCEWLCSQCLPGLVTFLEQSFPGLRMVEAGYDEDEAMEGIQRSDSSFVEVDEQTVEFEDTMTVRVGAFRIARFATRVREFREFVEATGYRTTAEQNGASESFLYNAANEACSKRELAESSVSCVSYNDAVAYCSWRGVRLPTEAEWLAASVADPKIYSRNEYDQQRLWERGGKFLPDLNMEWTGTIDSSGLGILRRGPRWARMETWREDIHEHRFAEPLDSYDIMTTFRVVQVGALKS